MKKVFKIYWQEDGKGKLKAYSQLLFLTEEEALKFIPVSPNNEKGFIQNEYVILPVYIEESFYKWLDL